MQYTAENARKVMLGLKTVTRRPVKLGDLGIKATPQLQFATKAQLARPDSPFIEVLRKDKTGLYRLKWRLSRLYAIQPGRGKLSLGAQELIRIDREPVEAITEEQARLEGFDNTGQFFDVWRALYGPEVDLSAEAWALTFGPVIVYEERMHLWAR